MLLALLGAGRACADEPCAADTWDIGRERALYATKARMLSAGRDASAAPAVAAGQLYELPLRPLADVELLLPPGKATGGQAVRAGLATFMAERGGTYRVAIDAAVKELARATRLEAKAGKPAKPV